MSGKNRKAHKNVLMQIILTDGNRFTDYILASESKYYRFKGRGRVPRRNIRSISTCRGATP